MERTLILLKPDAVQRDLVGEIIARLERKGLKLVGLKMMQLTDELLNEHYSHLVSRPFFPEVKSFMQLTPVIACCVEGTECVAAVRQLVGITKAREAAPGTIRGEFAMSTQANLIHCSDSLESAEVEVKRFFKPEEIFEYKDVQEQYVYNSGERG
ncbi:nucleoside-diphosphate kinase [Tengunoibacter tsumagoiensis]|uniref:Nucleoside diphosphate kinase n=1 Tax=Tengunoibacter tsumagoiensis TaxID=2014871 RepID=A0A402A0N6_9CHLR|nr:nucleoside-diphosphate kinase [Tengunoibacter tsumagoiensis]GCE12571.1 nucleoside-diphosphate kinase [Tengunoibacter tsumagoiensis]